MVKYFMFVYLQVLEVEVTSSNVNSLHAGYLFMLPFSSADFFSKLTFSKNSFRNTHRVLMKRFGFRQNIGPDLCPNCLQRLSAEDKSHRKQGKSLTLNLMPMKHEFSNI